MTTIPFPVAMRALYKRHVRMLLAEGWHAWVAPGGRTLWARVTHTDHVTWSSERMQTRAPAPGELAVLDEVLREKVS